MDTVEAEPPLEDPTKEDTRMLRLEEEVRVWQPASHAAWANWAVVQARDEILSKVEEWLAQPKAAAKAEEAAAASGSTPTEEPKLQRTKSGELIYKPTGEMVDTDAGNGNEAEFDYLLYGQQRMDMFRKEIKALGVDAN